MPTHEDRGSDDRDGLEDRWKPSIQLDQEQAIPICELSATPHSPLQYDQLMTERSALRLSRREGRDEQGKEETEIIAADVRRFGHVINKNEVLVHTRRTM